LIGDALQALVQKLGNVVYRQNQRNTGWFKH
jgi:hypothetical protein